MMPDPLNFAAPEAAALGDLPNDGPAPRPIRVLSCLHSFEPGGVERDVLRFNGAWRAHGIDACIALGRREGVLEPEAPDVPFFVMQKGRFSTARFETLWMILNLPGIIRRAKPDVIFCASNGLAAVAMAMRLILGRSCPPIVLRISNDLVRRDLKGLTLLLHRIGLRLHAPYHRVIVAMAPPVRDEIIEQMGVDPAAVVVINNASMKLADVAAFAKARDAARREGPGRHFLGVGRLAPQKNFALLIDAFSRIARDDDKLTIVGEGAQRAFLTQRAAALGIARQVDLPGHHRGLEQRFAQADAFVLSSDFEGVPAVVVEALAAGMPIVATDCCTAMPSLLDGVGRLVPLGDAAQLAAEMDTICAADVPVAAMRARAAEFTIEATVGQWEALFTRLATIPAH